MSPALLNLPAPSCCCFPSQAWQAPFSRQDSTALPHLPLSAKGSLGWQSVGWPKAEMGWGDRQMEGVETHAAVWAGSQAPTF